MKRLVPIVLLLVSAGSMASFLLDADYLDRSLPLGLPAGVAAAAISLIAAAGIPIASVPVGSKLRASAMAAIIAATLWLPATVALAGGPTLHLSGWRSTAWLLSSGGLLLLIVGNLAWTLLACMRPSEAAARTRRSWL